MNPSHHVVDPGFVTEAVDAYYDSLSNDEVIALEDLLSGLDPDVQNYLLAFRAFAHTMQDDPVPEWLWESELGRLTPQED